MAEPPANYDTSFSLIDSLVTEIQNFDKVSEATNEVSKLASIAKFAVDKVDRAEKLCKDTKEKLERKEQRYKATQEEIHQLRRDNDGSVELKQANQVNLSERDKIIQKLQDELAEKKRDIADAVEETKYALNAKITDQEQRIVELSLNVGEKEESIKELQEENSRLNHAMRQVGSAVSDRHPSQSRASRTKVKSSHVQPNIEGDEFYQI